MALDIGRRRFAREATRGPRRGPAGAGGGHRRGGTVRAGHGHAAGPVRDPRLHHRRAVRRGGRHLAGQHLSRAAAATSRPTSTRSPSPPSPTGPAGSPNSPRSSPTPSGAWRGSGLGPHLRLGTTVRSAEFDEDRPAGGGWRSHSDDGDEELVADTVVFACGQLNRPHVPDLDGLEPFAGPCVALGPLGPRRTTSPAGGWRWWAAEPAPSSSSRRWPNRRPSSPSTSAAPTTWARRRTAPTAGGRGGSSTTSTPSSAPTGGGSTGASSSAGSGSARTAGPGASSGSCSRADLRDGVVSDRLPETGRRPRLPHRVQADPDLQRLVPGHRCGPTSPWSTNPSTTSRPTPWSPPTALRHPADVLIFGTGFSTTDFLAHIPVTGMGGAHPGRGVERRGPGLPRDRGARLPQLLLPLRPEHQPRATTRSCSWWSAR